MKIYDSLLGFIHFDELEEQILDSIAFQRLRFIRQVGPTFFLYPGATHSRFEHSIGVMKIATKIFDTLFDRKNLEEILERTHDLTPNREAFERLLSEPRELFERALKILRLTALCHDLGHLPFSHTAEEELLGPKGHEKKTVEILYSDVMAPIWEKASRVLGGDVKKEIAELITKEVKDPLGEILSEIITNDYFGADRVDYLLRDATYTGVTHGLFDSEQLIDSLRLLPVENGVSIGVLKSGIQAIESLLISRYFMYSRVYRHPVGAAFAFHLKRFLSTHYAEAPELASTEAFLEWSDPDVLVKIKSQKEDVDARAILYRQERYATLWLDSKEWTQEQWKALLVFIEELQESYPEIFFTWKETSLAGESSYTMLKKLKVLQWGRVEDFDIKQCLQIPQVSSCYLFIPPNRKEVVQEGLKKRFGILPKFY